MTKPTVKPATRKKEVPAAEGLDTPVKFCPGVGPKRAFLLEKMGILTVGDLIWHLPRAYEDHHSLLPIRHLKPGQVITVVGDVTSVNEKIPKNRSKVRHILEAVVEDYSGSMICVWFNQPYLMEKVKEGERVSLHGKVDLHNHFIRMSSPKLQVVGRDEGERPEILPLYPLCEGLAQAHLRNSIRKAFDRFGSYIKEFLPAAILNEYKFPNRQEAFRVIHFPKAGEGAPTDVQNSEQDFLLPVGSEALDVLENLREGDPGSLWERSRRRLIFEELFQHQLMLRRYSENIKKLEGIAHPRPNPDPWKGSPESLDVRNPRHWPALLVKNLPFQLTYDQQRVCQEIQTDMSMPSPMNRLLQGDVGSGKTVVSLYAMVMAASGGMQAALMAPTELLAQQHVLSCRKLLQSLIPHVNMVLLTGSTKTAERREALELIVSGAVQIVIGTHALFQEDVLFQNLGLVIVDEQHKFGVEQRQTLVKKGRHPDLLVTTATPIPRTLSLTLFGDMDVSTIKELPPGRPQIVTRWTTWENEEKLWGFVDQKIGEGQQAYVVCPIIGPSESVPHLPSTDEAFERLSLTYLPKRRVAILHGGHSSEEKQDVMRRMHSGELDLVVSTTVIEVGVDLPNATVMVVLGAERFGLAQLHQLRGRVGRGTLKSFCILMTAENINPIAKRRMKVMESSRDGFLIAEEDLRLRGPGEQLGTRQSGRFRFRLADPFHDEEILQESRRSADKVLGEDPDMAQAQHQHLKRDLERNYGTIELMRPS